MAMSWLLCGMLALSLGAALATGQAASLTPAAMDGAQAAVTLAVALAGPLCLWSGVGEAMRRSGISYGLARLCAPLLRRLFPQAWRDPEAAGFLGANFAANLLGLGNAATPMGIAAVKRMYHQGPASDELCRLIVLNTASVQLLPTTVAGVRASLGASSPLDILPAVWLSSLCSVTAGLLAARLLAKRWHN